MGYLRITRLLTLVLALGLAGSACGRAGQTATAADPAADGTAPTSTAASTVADPAHADSALAPTAPADGEPARSPAGGDPAESEPAGGEEPGWRAPPGEVTITADQGDGWRLVEAEPGFGHPHEVSIMTSERGLDRAAADRWFKTRPTLDADGEVAIVLAPSVSGSCPAIVFNGLVITDDRVYGRFAPGPPPTDAGYCSSDANPISFVFLVERRALPERFTLSVEADVRCEGCGQAEILVDLADEAALERALWGGGTLDIVIDGTPPRPGTANVFRWAPDAALLLHATEFVDLPRWIQGFEPGHARTIEGFVVDCGDGGCPEECDDGSCQALQPRGAICTHHHEPVPFVDHTVTITWDGDDCTITVTHSQP